MLLISTCLIKYEACQAGRRGDSPGEADASRDLPELQRGEALIIIIIVIYIIIIIKTKLNKYIYIYIYVHTYLLQLELGPEARELELGFARQRDGLRGRAIRQNLGK